MGKRQLHKSQAKGFWSIQVRNPVSFKFVDGTWAEIKSQFTEIHFSQMFFIKVVLIPLVCLNSSSNFSSEFGFIRLFDVTKTRWNIMIDSWDWLAIGRGIVLVGPISSNIYCAVQHKITFSAQDGSISIPNILAKLHDIGRRWSHVINNHMWHQQYLFKIGISNFPDPQILSSCHLLPIPCNAWTMLLISSTWVTTNSLDMLL